MTSLEADKIFASVSLIYSKFTFAVNTFIFSGQRQFLNITLILKNITVCKQPIN